MLVLTSCPFQLQFPTPRALRVTSRALSVLVVAPQVVAGSPTTDVYRRTSPRVLHPGEIGASALDTVSLDPLPPVVNVWMHLARIVDHGNAVVYARPMVGQVRQRLSPYRRFFLTDLDDYVFFVGCPSPPTAGEALETVARPRLDLLAPACLMVDAFPGERSQLQRGLAHSG